MKLLLDQNLPARLCQSLADVFPVMQHVRLIGLHQADDLTIWRHAQANSLTIVSKDGDFFDLVTLKGAPLE